MKNKIKAVILGNETEADQQLWINACESRNAQIEYRIVDLTRNRWLEEIQAAPFDILLAKPGGLTSAFKQLYDERIYVLSKIPGYKIYPSPDEIFIYENKRFFSFWLKTNKISHPQTDVFYFQDEALQFLAKTTYPVVAKANIGASGSGVVILRSKDDAIDYVKDTFSGKGAKQRVGPNLAKGGVLKRGFHYVLNPSDINKKLKLYSAIANDVQIGMVIFQQFIPHQFEWRVVRIGDSFFAHKKMLMGEKASGSLLKNYDNPPLALFDFVKQITDKHGFYSQAVDVFESGDSFLINEMQCIFGQSDKFQMMVDGKIGRYLFINGQWKFEEGDFNKNESYDLRIDWVIKMFQ